MYKHIVFWTFSEAAVTAGNTDALLQQLQASTAKMAAQIDDLLAAEIGRNVAGSEWDFVFYTEFENPEALARYLKHPLHVAHAEMAKPWVDRRTVCDYWV